MAIQFDVQNCEERTKGNNHCVIVFLFGLSQDRFLGARYKFADICKKLTCQSYVDNVAQFELFIPAKDKDEAKRIAEWTAADLGFKLWRRQPDTAPRRELE